jgi:hypothetical protein
MNMFATMATMDPASSDASESGSEEEQEAPWGQHCDRSAAGGTGTENNDGEATQMPAPATAAEDICGRSAAGVTDSRHQQRAPGGGCGRDDYLRVPAPRYPDDLASLDSHDGIRRRRRRRRADSSTLRLRRTWHPRRAAGQELLRTRVVPTARRGNAKPDLPPLPAASRPVARP